MKESTTSAAVIPAAIVEEAWQDVGASFERFCLTAGMEEDAARLCGPRYGRAEDKAGPRRGKTKGKVGFHGGKVEVERPRVRVRDGCEMALPSWETAQSEDLLGRWALNLMLINVSTRHFGRAVRPPEGDISAAKGAAVVQALLDNPVGRGFDPTVCRLFVVDGTKALSKAIRRTFGRHTPIQRCQVHKARNITDMNGTIRQVCRNVKRRRDAKMALRSTAAGMMAAAKGFRRLKARRQLPVLRAALAAHQAKYAVAPDPLNSRPRPHRRLNQRRLPSEFQHGSGHPPAPAPSALPRGGGPP